MKILILLTLVIGSSSSFAKKKDKTNYVHPQVIVMANGVDVRVYNTTDKDVRCSGMVSVWTASGRYISHFYNSTVYRGMSDYRHFTNFDYRDAYRTGYNSIYCTSY
jgi:hypothetical protein